MIVVLYAHARTNTSLLYVIIALFSPYSPYQALSYASDLRKHQGRKLRDRKNGSPLAPVVGPCRTLSPSGPSPCPACIRLPPDQGPKRFGPLPLPGPRPACPRRPFFWSLSGKGTEGRQGLNWYRRRGVVEPTPSQAQAGTRTGCRSEPSTGLMGSMREAPTQAITP